MPTRRPTPLILGVDTGGTFTDLVYRDAAASGAARSGRLKVLSTPDDPSRAVLEGIASLFGERAPDLLQYGTTVATNAMLERRGARTVLLTTAGFEDVIEIGRQARPALYDLEPRRVEPLVPPRLRIGVKERVLFDGRVEVALAAAEVRRVVRRVRALRAEAVAVCLLHCNEHPRHEQVLGEALAPLDIPVTLSHRISPTVGEFERTSTAVANAYVQPRVASHVEALASGCRARRLRVMQSSGTAIGASTAAREPVRTMLSGPAGGVAAAAAVASAAGVPRIVTLDMGGTSTDVAFVDGDPPRRSDTLIGGFALRVPCIDIHTVGAGGGSIAALDEGGALRVGPRSAGADPGPACYGKGTEPTVTDANVALGRLPAAHFLGGTMSLDIARARTALEPLRRAIGARTVEDAAEDVVRVVEGNMEKAIRAITVQRGQDPRSAVLLPFGGAAGLHACGLAAAMGFPEVLIPKDPGLLSAIGVRDGSVGMDRLVPLVATNPAAAWLASRAKQPAARLRAEVVREGFTPREVELAVFVRLRYARQAIELEVPLASSYRRDFDRAHQRLFHASDAAWPVEVVGLRVQAKARASSRRPIPLAQRNSPRSVPVTVAPVAFAGRKLATPIHERDGLAPGARLRGPAIVAEYSSTTVIPPGWSARVDAAGNLRLSAAK